jgi:hypothetical protein
VTAQPRLVFRSRVDNWVVALACLPLIIAALFVASTVHHDLDVSVYLGLIVVLASTALPFWLLKTTRYILTDEDLLVRTGPLRWDIALGDIRKVTPTRSLLSGPALSVQRLRIDYGRGASLLISPQDESRFLEELERRSMQRSSLGGND